MSFMEQPPILSHYQTRQLTGYDLPTAIYLSIDLGLSTISAQNISTGWLLPDGQVLTHSQISTINEDENSCFLLVNGILQKVETFSETTQRYYSLMPTSSAPTLLISGIPMHRTKDINPWEDTKRKIQALGKPYGLVLDTTTGLGYTAIQAALSAEAVITVEFDPAVLAICRFNPWSKGLFTNPKIHKLIGDSADIAYIFPDTTFHAIIHDPPTFNLAGQLYSGALYHQFHRILTANGALFHYIGNPDSRTGATVGRGVVERLRKAGFTVKPKGKAFGVLAKKSHP